MSYNQYAPRNICQAQCDVYTRPVEVACDAWHSCDVRNLGEEIGVRIRHALVQTNGKQIALARASGLSQGTLSHLMGGTRKDPGVTNVVIIAQTLGVSLDWLLTGKGAPSGTPKNAYERACEAFVLLAANPAEACEFVATQANLYSQHTDRLTAEDHLGFLRVSYPRWVAGADDPLPAGVKYRAPREVHEVNPRSRKINSDKR